MKQALSVLLVVLAFSCLAIPVIVYPPIIVWYVVAFGVLFVVGLFSSVVYGIFFEPESQKKDPF